MSTSIQPSAVTVASLSRSVPLFSCRPIFWLAVR
jgi:hypothetical protein